MFSGQKSANVKQHPDAGMRRVIRHIFTIVTFERWTIKWEKAPKNETASHDDGAERFWVEVKRDLSANEHMTGELSEEKTRE